MKLLNRMMIFATVLFPFAAGASVPSIIPFPQNIEQREGEFTITRHTKLHSDEAGREVALYLADYLNTALGAKFKVSHMSRTIPVESITIQVDGSLPQQLTEGYRLEVNRNRVSIIGRDRDGLFYGVQTLLQLMPAEVYGRKKMASEISIPALSIEDYPAFKYRGIMLDVARTFYSVAQLKRQLDFMAYHKLNVFHWHLTEDEAWRPEIKAIPELAKIGGFRGGDSPVYPVYGKFDQKYGGYYTHEDMREVVEYARVRGIEVIPEIDLPGHSRTTALIFPEVLCGGPVDTITTLGYDMRNVMCASREANYTMLETIVGELCDIFPSERFHIGGDEVNFAQWLSCPNCQTFMSEQGMSNGAELQEYFTNRMIDIVTRHGKRVAVWDEAVDGGALTKDALVGCWHVPDVGRRIAADGYEIVMMTSPYFYIDMRQSPFEGGPRWSSDKMDSDWMLGFDFETHLFTPESMQNVAGMEAPLWAETILQHGVEMADYYLYPRVSALAQMCWGGATGKAAMRDRFNAAMRDKHFYRLAEMGCRARMRPLNFTVADGVITAGSEIAEAKIHYTNDGSEPTRESKLYTAPIKDQVTANYRFRAYHKSLETPVCAADSAYFDFLKPNITITSSLTEHELHPFSDINCYNWINWVEFNGPVRTTDWVIMSFDEPLEFDRADLIVGFEYMPRWIMVTGYVEASGDGVNFERCGDLKDGRYTLRPKGKVKAIRVVNTHDGNYESGLRMFSPIIHRKR